MFRAITFLLLAFSVAGATLEWDRNPEDNVIGYRVYVGRVSRLYDSVLDIGNQITTQVPTAPGRTYFAVTAYDSDGLESDYSEEVFYTMTNPPAPPTPPTNVRITNGNTVLVTISLLTKTNLALPWQGTGVTNSMQFDVSEPERFFASNVSVVLQPLTPQTQTAAAPRVFSNPLTHNPKSGHLLPRPK